MTADACDLTDDLFLGGRLRLLQPRRGHRVGSDAALLAAAARSRMAPGARVADLGAGVGAVGLALTLQGAGSVALVEIESSLVALAADNARRNGFETRAFAVCVDVAKIGLGPETEPRPGEMDLVAANPPFDDAGRFRASPDPARARAHAAPDDLADIWLRAAARLLKPGGDLFLIHRPEALGLLIAAAAGRFGELRVRPVHPRADEPAIRILVAGRKGRRGGLALLPGLALHGPDGAFTPEADAAQRGDAAIAMG